jgi:hypothetical protein
LSKPNHNLIANSEVYKTSGKSSGRLKINKSSILAFFVVLLSIYTLKGCDSAPGINDVTVSPNILSNLQVIPGDIILEPTTETEEKTFDFTIQVNQDSDALTGAPSYRVLKINTGEVIAEGRFIDNRGGFYAADFDVTASTTSLTELTIFAYAATGNGVLSNTLSRKVRIVGSLSEPPFLEYLDHPEVVVIPTSGTTPIRFETSAIHPNGQDNIEQVLLDLFDSNGNQLGGSSFEMELDDTPGNDRIYSITFQINPNNQPETYDIRAYAIDRLSVSSDTLFSTMSFVNP